jgi:uncharacterized protein
MRKPELRLLIVPGLNDSGPAHWQTWLQSRTPHAVRVQQRHWNEPDLDRWADRIADAVDAAGDRVQWVAAAHSFGCLALVRHLQRHPNSPIRAALLVAPADPAKFGVDTTLPRSRLAVDCTWLASTDDPWMSLHESALWAGRWGCRWVNLGAVGHINAESGFGPLPIAAHWVRAATQRMQRSQRAQRAEFAEWSFAQ